MNKGNEHTTHEALRTLMQSMASQLMWHVGVSMVEVRMLYADSQDPCWGIRYLEVDSATGQTREVPPPKAEDGVVVPFYQSSAFALRGAVHHITLVRDWGAHGIFGTAYYKYGNESRWMAVILKDLAALRAGMGVEVVGGTAQAVSPPPPVFKG